MEIDVTKYFVIHKDKRGKIFAIEQINPKELFEAITKQNEQLHRYKQTIKDIKEIAITHDMPSCLKNDCNCDICQDKITEHSKRCMEKGLRDILKKCEEVNVL